MTEFIRKFIGGAGLDIIKADGDGDGVRGRVIAGVGSTFEQPEQHDSHGDIIAPGAFDDAIREALDGRRRIKMLNSHGSPIGLWNEFKATSDGLIVAGKVSKTTEGDDVLELVNDKVIDGLSIGFPVAGSTFEELDVFTAWGAPVRRWTKVNLREISPTAFPSNHNAAILELRSSRAAEYQARVVAVEADTLDALAFDIIKARLDMNALDTTRRLERLIKTLGGSTK